MSHQTLHDRFRKGSHAVSNAIGSPYAFGLAVLAVIIWAIAGPFANYSDHWQLVINTGTTIITFLVVFLVQNTQNRDSKAIHLKLDELLRALESARTRLVELETWNDEQLKPLEREFEKLGGVPPRKQPEPHKH